MKLLKSKIVSSSSRRASLLCVAYVTMLAASALLITACDSSERKGTEALSAALPVGAVRVRQENVPLVGDWVGSTLDGFVNAQIQPQVSGYLVQQKYRKGSLVAKYQLNLVNLREREAQSLVQLYEALGGGWK